ncbi:hypothetical protein [uncultured Brevundimonas sp.]|uniref:hypothetical protein n=1 Tax=uncultured Brevundimonas sp. TaxID=213418 RepID=UPI002623B325|nr:hypothetical protein [uncultured Brevundimonas sp.]
MIDRDDDTERFETDEVEANRAIENGQGVGARELAAQRDPGGVETADEDDSFDNGKAVPKG